MPKLLEADSGYLRSAFGAQLLLTAHGGSWAKLRFPLATYLSLFAATPYALFKWQDCPDIRRSSAKPSSDRRGSGSDRPSAHTQSSFA